ncbi:cordon-bleu protein-like 1b [Chanos chanos]|uniref:Cordon-bleu protein-like 1b n=1 Tax=Chanos chanos TaxID=29144 RepID=A0A6J2WDU9_CHACN|nr:cordon-bleu protein-like 1 [Chanos chanos]
MEDDGYRDTQHCRLPCTRDYPFPPGPNPPSPSSSVSASRTLPLSQPFSSIQSTPTSTSNHNFVQEIGVSIGRALTNASNIAAVQNTVPNLFTLTNLFYLLIFVDSCSILKCLLWQDELSERRSYKTKAPPPPPSLSVLDGSRLSQRLPVYPPTAMDQKENLIDQDLTLVVVLPEGVEKTTIVHGSKAMMDLLVMLCAKYHLNPSSHTIELVSANRNHIKFKPNALIGALGAEKILLKAKGAEDKNKKTGPQMPEATVRLVINYKKTQKTILRVNPRVPLGELLPAICEKCEFDPQTTVLCRHVHSEDPLDLTHSLNDFGLREIYARDTKVISPVDVPPSPTHSGLISPGKDKTQKEKENKGLFGLFKRGSKKKSGPAMTVSAPASPVHRKQRPLSMSALSTCTPTYESNTMPSDTPKKRRAPLPPTMMSQSVTSDLSDSQPKTPADSNQNIPAVSRGSSAASSLKKTKRKAPPPPTSPTVATPEEPPQEKCMTGSAPPLEEIQEQEEIVTSQESSAVEETQEDDSSLNLSADISMDSGHRDSFQDAETESTSPSAGPEEDLSCDLSSDGKLAEDSVKHEEQEDQTARRETQDQSQTAENASADSALAPAEIEVDGAAITSTTPGQLCESSTDASVTTSHTSQTQTLQTEQEVSAQTSPKPSSETSMEKSDQTTETKTQTGSDLELSSCQLEESSSVAPSSSSSLSLKKDMATSTEELNNIVAQPAVPQTIQCPVSEQTVSAPKGAPLYITDTEPKPKPSNEVTRDYIPKVGMTTYTIVPQKSLEKLRVFEVELTLEAPPTTGQQEVMTETQDFTTQTNQPAVKVEQTEVLSSVAGEKPALSNGTSTPHSLKSNTSSPISASPSTPTSPMGRETSVSSPSELRSPGGLEGEMKDKKVPPATKPKPASFRLPQHKRIPGHYVTSAAAKGEISSPVSPREVVGSPVSPKSEPEHGKELESFPPPPPPVNWDQDGNEGPPAEMKGADPPANRLIRQMSLPVREVPVAGLSVEKLRTFAAPKPYSPATPSRFAQAVSSAVRRSQSLHGPMKGSPQKLNFPLTAHSPIREATHDPGSTMMDNSAKAEDKSIGLQGADDPNCSPASEAPVQTTEQKDLTQNSTLCGLDGSC